MAFQERGDIPMASTIFERPDRDEENYESLNRPNRIHSIHRNTTYSTNSSTNSRPGRNINNVREARTGGATTLRRDMVDGRIMERHANLIVSKMEQDTGLMEDTPSAEELRKEALRDMPQCLTVKRKVRVKLKYSVSQNSKQKRLGYFKTLKYRMSMSLSKVQADLKDLAYVFELWYGSLKTIEGNFGSGVASFFKFLRWLFILNVFVCVCSVAFIIVPQISYTYSTERNVTRPDEGFLVTDVFTGEGYFTKSALFYGFYSSESVSLSDLTYSMPDAYFFTILALYLVCFLVLTISVAQSYKKSFIETEGGLKNVYANKVFCGWDYGIATEDAATLKSSAIYHELKELLYESSTKKNSVSTLQALKTLSIQLGMNVVVLATLALAGYILWLLLDAAEDDPDLSIVTAILVNLIMAIFPFVFSFIVRYEDYKNPRTALLITLLRIFLLGFGVIGVFVTFWLGHSAQNDCWETCLGQEVYRLVLFDFIFSVIISGAFDVILHYTYKAMEFDIARHTMQIIYNQSLLWVGFFFSPILSIIIVIKLFLIWYIRKTLALKFCTPSAKSWRAAQTQTWFLILVFFSLLLTGALFGYIIVYVPTSSCGPFNNFKYTYEIVTGGLANWKANRPVVKVLFYITKPGCIALILIAISLWVYYLREKATAAYSKVLMYRELLVWESKDKEYLMQYISSVTRNQWQAKMQNNRDLDPIGSLPQLTSEGGGDYAPQTSNYQQYN